MRKITIADDSLKMLEKERENTLLFREKTAVAAAIARIGVDTLELPAVKKVKEDTIIYKTIVASAHGVRIALEVGADDPDSALAWECLKGAEDPCLQIALPVSAAGMEYSLGLKENVLLEKISAMVRAAAAKGAVVEFMAQDADRADRAFLLRAVQAAEEAGASFITVCDGSGSLLPEDAAALIRLVRGAVSVPVYMKNSDRLGLAAADALAALEAGADGLKTAISGEDALSTDVLAKILAEKAESLGYSCSLKTLGVHSSLEALLKKLEHRDYLSNGTQEGPGNSDIFLDAASTSADVSRAVRSLGYDLSEEDEGKVYEALRKICEKKVSVGRRELEAIVSSAAMQVPSTYHLDSYSICAGSRINSMAQVTLVKDGQQLSGVATGDGPVDSAFLALEQSIGYHYELDDFQIQAITEGKESLGSTLVKLRSGGKLYSGTGLSTDIVGASIRAYINALNKIVYEERS